LNIVKKPSRRIKTLLVLTILLASTGIIGAYATAQTKTVPIEVKEPLEVLSFDSNLSLYPGETRQFNVAVENHASVSYTAALTFGLNDTAYQQNYVNFSGTIYTVHPGTNMLVAWLSVINTAPAAELELTINITRNADEIDILPIPTPSILPTDLDPSMTLFAAGATWAANNGTSVLYINWYDTYCEHHVSDPDWGPWWREGQMVEIKNVTVNLLEQLGFTVTCTGEMPEALAGYDLVVFESWFAVEPKHVQLVREYLADGGNIVVIGGVPCYFATYCRDMWPYVTGGTNLAALSDWFGSAQFANSGGEAKLVVDKPFGAPLEKDSTIYQIDAYGCYALTSMSSDAQVLARWGNDLVYSFTYEYDGGRVFYQAEMVW